MIRKVYVQNFRKHSQYLLDLTNNKTIITGPNGSGKTSLIEAIYVSLVGKSWRSNFTEIIKSNASWWQINTEDEQTKRLVRYSGGESVFNIDNKKTRRLPMKYRMPVILFEPNDLNLLNNSPSARRSYIDNLIASLDVEYSKIVRRYDRILKQRNKLLKQNISRDDLFVWNVQLADMAAHIISARRKFIQKISPYLIDEYQRINGGSNILTIKYQYYCDDVNEIRQNILGELYDNYHQEVVTGHTSVGPHQHDFGFYINEKLAVSTLSRGENRSVILALKNIEFILKKDFSPLILLDDVLSEFDNNHQKNLLGSFSDNQVIITSVKAPVAIKNFLRVDLS